MTIVAKIEIMEERRAVAKMMGHEDVVKHYDFEIQKMESEQRSRNLMDCLVRDKMTK